jgi:hypothetical protein
MDKTDELIARTEQLLGVMEKLQAAITQLQTDLRSHSQELDAYLDGTRKKPVPIKPVTTQERRAAPRRKGNPVSVYIRNGNADPFQGWVVDRSSGGLRLLVDDPLEPGCVLSVRPVKVHPAFPWVQVRVKNCHPERKSWSVGCQFVHKLAWDDLQQFG